MRCTHCIAVATMPASTTRLLGWIRMGRMTVAVAYQCAMTPCFIYSSRFIRAGKDKPVIKKALVDLRSLPFKTFATHRPEWGLGDHYRCPGPIQLTSSTTPGKTEAKPLCFTLALELKERKDASFNLKSPVPAHNGDLSGYRCVTAWRTCDDGDVDDDAGVGRMFLRTSLRVLGVLAG